MRRKDLAYRRWNFARRIIGHHFKGRARRLTSTFSLPPSKLPSVGEPFGEAFRQTGGTDFLLSRGNVVIQPAQLDRALVHVVDNISGFGIVIAGLADSADVDEIFFAGLDFEF